ncbi:helix-turn-helix transcriptional regulator [Streptomyces sp. NEAU-S7GS2]|uniref:helix-turn-helix domain-containing protein n=1 Tax=Streptomyces sp. NEAU-S7GS2 TaxID=2202000 RepID=UPI000D6FA008|nr:helix-turn-helix transcriptional regulator [Streptomyces sp. NEAU-S7GS2]AWN24822.1 transcriptional regulator [Streptomyces sp. NEAU-S7GS2]
MTQWQDRTTGQRVKILRGDRMTQEDLATASAVSLGTIRKLEQGGNLSLPYLLRVAGGLGTDVSTILGQQAPRRGMDRDERQALRAVSAAVHASAMGDAGDIEPGPLEGLREAARKADQAFWAGHYVELGALLGGLLPEARALRDSSTGAQREAAAGVLVDGFQTAATMANILGARDLGYASIAYGRQAAEEAGDDLRGAHLCASLSWIYLRDGHTKRGVQVAERAAAKVEPRMSDSDPDRLSVYGQLITNAAVASSRGGASPDTARDYLSQAHAVAARVGREHARGEQGQPFGPSYAATQALSVALALGDTGEALQLVETAHLDGALPLSTQARWRLDVALLRTESRQWDAAVTELEKVCQMAPTWVRHQALPGVIVGRLADVSVTKVRKVAAAAGVSLGL